MSRIVPLTVLAAVLAVVACTSDVTDRAVEVEVVEVFGPWRGVDADHFAEVLAPFEDSSGIDVRYVGSVDFVTDLLDRVGDGNAAPSVAMIPQPALIRQLAAGENIVPLAPEMLDEVLQNFGPDGAALGLVDGRYYTVPYRISLKSLVWYRPDVFAEQGWSIPSSLDELTALVERIEADAQFAPWCLGINAGTSTGWAATDWAEDLVLRTVGPDDYQRWAIGEIRFDDPDIAAAFEQFRSLVLDSGRTSGGAGAIVETPVDEAIRPLLTDPPGCALHRQADFAANWLPDGKSIGPEGDVDVFVLPGVDGGSPPLLVGATQAAQFDRDPSTDALMTYLSSSEAAVIWARRGGFLSLNQLVPDDVYDDDYLRDLAAAIEEAPAVVFDASDQMPPEIGSDLLWDRITAWVAGTTDYDDFAAEIDEARAELEARRP